MPLDLICFSHLRWNFVYQRPQHLLSRFAKHRRIFYIEEPFFNQERNYYSIHKAEDVFIVNFYLLQSLSEEDMLQQQAELLDLLLEEQEIEMYNTWYYTPLAYRFSNHLSPKVLIYDCMDELSAFKFAPPALTQSEKELLSNADIVFTGGYSLYDAKKDKHPNVYPFPSSLDKAHFLTARHELPDVADQQSIPHPRFGFYGVVDERFNLELLNQIANLQPDWHFVIIGPVVKIEEGSLPKSSNIHYLGGKSYQELPTYLSGWDVAIMPFALNESTKFISPTKTPEYLSGGKQVISTSIKDVVEPYGRKGLVQIADTAEDFVAAGKKALSKANHNEWLKKVDDFLAGISWDKTWAEMNQIIEKEIAKKQITQKKKFNQYV